MPSPLKCCWPVLLALLVACSSPQQTRPTLPEPRLSPAAHQAEQSLSQRLTLLRGPSAPGATQGIQSLEAQLEIDPNMLRFAAFSLGQRVLSFSWDGHALHEERASLLPASVTAQHILRDVQWTYAPAEALQRALGPEWQLKDSPQQRILSYRGNTALLIDYTGARPWSAKATLDNRLEGYQLLIESTVHTGQE